VNNSLKKRELSSKLSDLKAKALVLQHDDPAPVQREVAAELGLAVIDMKPDAEGPQPCVLKHAEM